MKHILQTSKSAGSKISKQKCLQSWKITLKFFTTSTFVETPTND